MALNCVPVPSVTAAVSNHAALSSLRRVQANTTQCLDRLTRTLHSAFPSLHASQTGTVASTVAEPRAPHHLSALDAIVSSSIRRCSAQYGGGGSVHGVWCGLNVESVSVEASAQSAVSTSSWTGGAVAYLVASLPRVMRVQVTLTSSSQPLGTLRAVRVLSWDEQLLEPPRPHSAAAHTSAPIHTTPAASTYHASPSHASLSSRHVMQLVQAQLTAHLHRCNSLLVESSSSLQLTSSSSAPLSPSPAVSSSCPLFHFLVHVGSYHSLFTSPCVCCGELLQYHDDSAALTPCVVRTVSGASVHARCMHALTADIHSTHTDTQHTHNTQPHAQASDVKGGGNSQAGGGAEHSTAG